MAELEAKGIGLSEGPSSKGFTILHTPSI